MPNGKQRLYFEQSVHIFSQRGNRSMTNNNLNLGRKSFSSPAQIDKMAMMVMSRWSEVWPVVSQRYQLEQKKRNDQIRLSIQKNALMTRA
jgi:hypothetical protein